MSWIILNFKRWNNCIRITVAIGLHIHYSVWFGFGDAFCIGFKLVRNVSLCFYLQVFVFIKLQFTSINGNESQIWVVVIAQLRPIFLFDNLVFGLGFTLSQLLHVFVIGSFCNDNWACRQFRPHLTTKCLVLLIVNPLVTKI